MASNKSKLTEKQRLFVHEYLVDLNATQAAIRAGYSEKTAQEQSSRLLSNVMVKEAVQKAMDERSERVEVTADRVLEELAKLGFADIRKVFTEGGHLRDIASLPDEIAAAVSSVEVVTRPDGEVDENGNRGVEYVHKLRFWDKRGSLELLGKHLKMFTDKTEHTIQLQSLAGAMKSAMSEDDDQG